MESYKVTDIGSETHKAECAAARKYCENYMKDGRERHTQIHSCMDIKTGMGSLEVCEIGQSQQ